GAQQGVLVIRAGNRQVSVDYWSGPVAVSCDVSVARAPTSPVIRRIGCGASCNTCLPIADTINAIASSGWRRVSVDLACFPDVGSNFGLVLPPQEFFHLVLEPFCLVTDGELDISFANVRLVKHAAVGRSVRFE